VIGNKIKLLEIDSDWLNDTTDGKVMPLTLSQDQPRKTLAKKIKELLNRSK